MIIDETNQSASDQPVIIHASCTAAQYRAVLSGPISQQSHALSQSNQPQRMCRDAAGLLCWSIRWLTEMLAVQRDKRAV